MEEKWTIKVDDTPKEDLSKQEVEQAVVEEAAAKLDNVEIQGESDVVKVDLSNPPAEEDKTEEADALQQVQGETEEGLLRDGRVGSELEQEVRDEEPIEKVEGEVSEEPELSQQAIQETERDEVIELVSQQEEEVPDVAVTEAIEEKQEIPQLPEGLDDLVKFMDETGGSLEDYVGLNKNYDDLHPVDLISEYYKKKYPHYNEERLQRKMNKDFSYKEDDDPDVIQDKKDAFEDATYEAKRFLNEQKDKYYSELKFNRSNSLSPEAQEATKFYNDYKKSQEDNDKLVKQFADQTKKLFNDEFKGFDFKVGNNKYRFKVSDVAKTREYQSDLNNFIGEFAGEDGTISDVAGYHKALFAAKNADKIAQHFYEQGRAEAIKEAAKKSKNIDMNPRSDASAMVRTKTGTQFKVVSGESSNGLKIKMRK